MANQESTGFSVPPAAIVNQIRTLLKERYKEGFPIIKEIIQNANDGGATRLDIGVTQGLKEVTHPLLREPALVFINNGTFRDSDAQAIGWFGVDFNAGNAAKIGKFGLGQKSIFHFCEAFFYVAHSNELSGNPDRGRFLNPWADPTNFALPDSKHPDWLQMRPSDKEIIETYLRENELLNHQEYNEYFILWLPLRSNSVKERCILPNYYDYQTIQNHLPCDMGSRIATLMPMLRSLRTVNYWLPDDDNKLEVAFQVHIDNSSKHFIYPKIEETVDDETEHILHGQITLNDQLMVYGGHEVVLSAKPFNVLLSASSEQFSNFWVALRESEFWPKRSTQDESGEPKSVPDKAIPHCGVIFSRRPIQDKARLTVQWAVFLPLSDENLGSSEFEQISSNGDWEYTLLLHGYFFLDSGRRSIEALADIYQGNVSQKAPTNDNQMARLWNTILATEGTLCQVLPALDKFCKCYSLVAEEITDLCNLLKQTNVFQREALQRFIYSQNYWVYQIKPKQECWQLVAQTTQILVIPSTPNWVAFPKLSDFAETYCLVLKQLPNLTPSCKPDIWKDSAIEAVLSSMSINQVFREETQLEFLVKWLQSVPQPLSSNIQTTLKSQLRKALISVGFEELSQQVQNVILLLHESHWFDFDCRNNKLLRVLNQKSPNILILPSTLTPQRQTVSRLTGQDAGALISALVKENSNIEHLVRQVISAVPPEELKHLRSQVNSVKFIPGFDCRDGKNKTYNLQEVASFSKQGKLFLNSNMSREIALDLQKALQDYKLVLIDHLFANKLCNEPVGECTYDACLTVLQKQPKLSNYTDRINLLGRLIQPIVQAGFHQLRFLLHGRPEHYDCSGTLYLASQNNSVWGKVASKVLEPWRIIPSVLAERIPQHIWHDLKIQEISPQSLIAELKPESLTGKDLPTKAERDEVLTEIAKKSEHELLWKGLALHETTDSRLVSVTQTTYLENPKVPILAELRSLVNLISQTNRPEWIPLWTEKAAIEIVLKQPQPEKFCNLLLKLITEIPKKTLDQEFPEQLKTKPWLPLQNQQVVAPNQIIFLGDRLKQFSLSSLEEVFKTENNAYFGPTSLKIKTTQETLRKICATWFEDRLLKFFLTETKKPSDHAFLILDLLKIFNNNSQAIGEDNRERLASTPWLLDCKNQARSPQQVIHLPALQAEATEILEQLTSQNYITSAMLHKDLNILEHIQIQKRFISGEDAFEILGEAAADLPQYYLGNLPEEKNLLYKLIRVFENCQEMPILALAQDVIPFELFIFPKILKPITDSRRVCKILNWLATTNPNPQKQVLEIYNHYLSIACNFSSFSSSILLKIKLLNQEYTWHSPDQLCDEKVNNGIDKLHILESKQREILSKYLEVSKSSQVETLAASEIIPEPSKIEQTGNNAQKLEEYFNSWLPFLPSQAIGGFLCLLAGSDPQMQNLAQSYLQRRPFQTLRDELVWPGLRTKKFNIQINKGQTQRVKNISGTYFDALISDAEIPQTIFLGELSQNLTIRTVNLSCIQPNELNNLLLNSIKQLICKFDSFYDAKENSIENIWQRLNDCQQMEIEVAKDFILKGCRYILRALGVKNLKISDQLKRWEDKEFALSDWERRSHKNNHEFEQLHQDIKLISAEIERLIQEDIDIQQEVLESVRRKIGEGQYGYHLSNIPFELFQNADDSIKELECFLDFIEPERRYYIVNWNDNRITFMHWGRPINQFIHPDHRNRNFRDRGFDRDLIKMLSFNISDKPSEATGKFGLGFKTVHLATQQPKIISGDLSFAVSGGLLPVPITSIQILDELRNHLDYEQPSPEITDGTLIDLELEPQLHSEAILKEFKQQANLLLVFAKEIRKCKLIGPNFHQELAWSFTPVFGITGIEYGQIRLPTKSGQWLTHKLLCFRLLAGDIAIALPANKLQAQSPLLEHSTFWVTTPTKETLGLQFIINSSFDVTTGRTSLDRNSNHNQQLIQHLGQQLGEKLCQLFKSAAGNNWSSLERILEFNGVDAYRFWEFLWEVLAADWLNKNIEGTIAGLLQAGFGGQSNGIGFLITSYAALPNGLTRQLVCLKNVRYQVKGLLAESKIFLKIASWSQFQKHYPTDCLVHYTIWQIVKKLLEINSPEREVQSLHLSDCLVGVLGDRRLINPETATQVGQLITPDQLREWKTSHQTEYEIIYSVLVEQAVFFQSEGGQYTSARQLLIRTQPEEEGKLVGFAPHTQVLDSAYKDHALQFFLACREQRATVPIEDLVTWAKAANTNIQKEAVLNYLVSGERRGQFAAFLKKAITGTWMEGYPGIRETLEINDQQAQVERAYRGEIEWSQVLNNYGLSTTAGITPSILNDETVEPDELLRNIYDWWQVRHQIEIKDYNQRLYPIEVENLQQKLRARDRGAWLMLFCLGATHTMGRTKHEQHREFINLCLQEGWWQIFSTSNPQSNHGEWMGVLNDYMKPSLDNTTWNYWMEKFPTIYRIASYLEPYIDSFYSVENIQSHFDLGRITAPRSNPAFQGGGPDAPPLPLGIGANFVLRELVRLKILQPTSNIYVSPHCFVPRANVRRTLMSLGCEDLNKSDYRYSRSIYQFLQKEFSRLNLDDEPTFYNCFDIPFELYSKQLNLTEIKVREDIGWYDDISEEEHC